MYYFTEEHQYKNGVNFTAGSKARDDVSEILMNRGYNKIYIDITNDRENETKLEKISSHRNIMKVWDKQLSILQAGDTLVIQFPVINHSLFLTKVLKKLKRKNVTIALLVHDLEVLRMALKDNVKMKEKLRIKFEETRLLESSDYIIVHNEKMKEYFLNNNFSENKLVNLELFDYLIPQEVYDQINEFKRSEPVVVAGALRRYKAGYIYRLPENIKFNLYGIGFENENKKNISYKGSFLPDELIKNISGSFGLVWDGPSTSTCEGTYGKYLKINNPHKVSLYLAMGFPVAIWSQAALADFIIENQCGIVIDNLEDLNQMISSISEEEYDQLKNNAKRISDKVRHGYFVNKAIDTIESR